MEFDLNELIVYATCPHKYKLYAKHGRLCNYQDTRYTVDTLLSKVYLHYLQEKGLGNCLTLRACIASFSKDLTKAGLIGTINKTSSNKITPAMLVACIDSIKKFIEYIDQYELICVSYPIIKDVVIDNIIHTVNTSADCIVFDPNKNAIRVITFNGSNFYTNHNVSHSIKSYMCLSQVKRELKFKDCIVHSIILDINSCTETEIKLDSIHRTNYSSVIKNIIIGMISKIVYPRPSYLACENCEYKNICVWVSSQK